MVHVTWDRNEPSATAYEVRRDGRPLTTVVVDEDAWDDAHAIDSEVIDGASHEYVVRAVLPDGAMSEWSGAAQVRIPHADDDTGLVVEVDDFGGSDHARAASAVAAVDEAGGGIVQFGARTYRLDEPLVIAGVDDVVLRGMGRDATFIEPSFRGSDDPCADRRPLILFRGQRQDLPGVRLARDVERGTEAVRVEGASNLEPGMVVAIDGGAGAATPRSHELAGVVQDPGGRDERSAWDAHEVVAVDGDVVRFRDPVSYPLDSTAEWTEIGRTGRRNGLEQLTVQGRSADARDHHQLVVADAVVEFRVAAVRSRWGNHNLLMLGGYGLTVVDFAGPHGGEAAWDGEPCKYRVSIVEAANVHIIASEFGEPAHDRNQSFVTVQKATRVLVRHSSFHGSRTYAFNEHGSGGGEHVFENNYVAVGPNARFAAVFLGNSTWGFAGPVLIRNNTFDGNSRDLYIQENSFETRFLHNRSRGSTVAVIEGYGWAGPDTPPDMHASLRLTIEGNTVAGRGDGVVLGAPASPWYPYDGVRDVRVVDNVFHVLGDPLRIHGTSDRIYVADNVGISAPHLRTARSDAATDAIWGTDHFGWTRTGAHERQTQ